MSPYLTNRWLWRSRNIAAWLALAMIVMACPPFAWVVDAFFGASFLLWFIAWNGAARGGMWRRLRVAAITVLLLLLLVLPAVEFSRRRLPVIEGQARDHLVV